MNLFDLIRSRDGSLSLTKLGAATFHLAIAAAVVGITIIRLVRYVHSPDLPLDAPLFEMAMWTLWASIAVGHAVVDKTGSQISAFKDRKLDVESGHGALK